MTTRRTPPVRVAIVGAGLMGRWHAAAAVRAGATIAAVVDPDRSRAAALAARHPGCPPLADLTPSLELADIVHVCTPTPTHVAMVRQILDARRHALVEKPLAPNSVETAELLALADSRGVLICPVHQFPFQDGVQQALAQLSAIGPVLHVDITICSAGAAGADAEARARMAGEILPHPLSLLQRVLGSQRLALLDWTVQQSPAGEIRATAQERGVTASILVSMSGRPTTNRMRLIGGAGTIDVDLFHGFAAIERGTVSRARKIAQPFTRSAIVSASAAANLLRRAWRREPAYPGLRQLLERVYLAVATGGESPIRPAETLDVARACERLIPVGTSRLARAGAG